MPLAQVAASCPIVAGVELGGTKCVALLARGSEVLAREIIPTGEALPTIARLVDRVRAWRDEGNAIAAIGLGSFGPLGLDPSRPDFGHITTTPKPGWANIDLRGAFADAFDLPIGFDTDVNGAALAEGRWGASRGAAVHVYLTIGTGIGGGLVIGGRPVHGMLHPEMGHIRIRRSEGGRFAGICPYHGDCLEGLASGRAIAARAGRPAGELAGDDPLWREIAAELAELMAMLILTVSPEKIVIGGGVGLGRPGLFPLIHAATAAALNAYVAGMTEARLREMIRPPALGADAGPLGAAALAQDALGGMPRIG